VATVLLVEDDQDAAEVATAALRKAGHRVMSVPNGREALALLVLHTMDVVVTDLRMPEMDGLTLVSVIRSYLRWQSLPVIVFSAYAQGRNEARLRTLGVSEVLLKGSSGLPDLIDAVQRHVVPPPATNRN